MAKRTYGGESAFIYFKRCLLPPERVKGPNRDHLFEMVCKKSSDRAGESLNKYTKDRH